MTPPAAAAAIPAARPAPARPAPARPARPSLPRNPARPGRGVRRGASVRPRGVRAPAERAVRTETLALSRLLDRLIRGRVWIFLVAFALIGIVAMQLWLLKLNGGIGRAIEHESYLQRANAALSAENSAMSAGDLVEQHAFASGMTIVPPGALIFLRARGSVDERLAAARLAQPVPARTATAGTASTASTEAAASTATAGTASTASTEAVAPTATAGTASTAPTATAAPDTATAPTTSTAPTEAAASTTTQTEPQG